MNNGNKGPLAGIKVVDISIMQAAPIATRALAEWGADVIKVEDMAGRDAIRTFGPVLGVPIAEDENPLADDTIGGKRNICLDLKSPEGMEVFNKILEDADVLVTNFRLDALKKLNISYDDLKVKFPGLIYGHLLSYGEEGPDKDRPGYDQCAFLARSGLMTELVEPGDSPLNSCAGFGDRITGMNLAGGICAALVRKLKTGQGEYVKVSLLHSAIHGLTNLLIGTQYGKLKYPLTRKKPVVVTANTYKTKDGRWLLLSETKIQQNWGKWCNTLGLGHLAGEEKYKSALGILQDTVYLTEQFEAAIVKKDIGEWMEIIADADLVCEKCQTFEELINDPQVEANNFLIPFEYPSGVIKVGTMPVQYKEAGMQEYRKAAKPGANTLEIMQALGYDATQIEKLKEEKVIG